MLQLKILVRIVNQSDSDVDYPFGISFENLNVSVPDDIELTAATLNPFVVKAFHDLNGFNRNLFVDVVTFGEEATSIVVNILSEDIVFTIGTSPLTQQIVWEVLPIGAAQTVTFSIEQDEDTPATGLTVNSDGLVDASDVVSTGEATIRVTSTEDTGVFATILVTVQDQV